MLEFRTYFEDNKFEDNKLPILLIYYERIGT